MTMAPQELDMIITTVRQELGMAKAKVVTLAASMGERQGWNNRARQELDMIATFRRELDMVTKLLDLAARLAWEKG